MFNVSRKFLTAACKHSGKEFMDSKNRYFFNTLYSFTMTISGLKKFGLEGLTVTTVYT